jgi:2-keto-3-deoxy-6-phosphogluconate aldolase
VAGTRNGFGFNDTTECFRTFGGEKFIGWGGGISKARIAAYRAAGVRCRRLGDDVYVREADSAKAVDVDSQVGTDF